MNLPPMRLPLMFSRWLLLTPVVALIGCASGPREDGSAAPVEDLSITSPRQLARTVAGAAEVSPMQPPRAEPTTPPVAETSRSSAAAPAPNATAKAAAAPATTSPDGVITSTWPPPRLLEPTTREQEGKVLLPGDPGYRYERLEIGSEIGDAKPPTLPPPATAAAKAPGKPLATPPATPVATPPAVPPVAMAAAPEDVGLAASTIAGENKPPAVAALLADADRQTSAGNNDGAAAALERALRVEPRDAFLWHRLAYVRLQQGRGSEAESLALKSNSLAGDKLELVDANWRLISRARRQLNDAAGVREAESHLRR